MRLAVVTPWWNHLELLPGWFDAVNVDGVSLVAVVDNGSQPPFPEMPQSSKLVVFRNERNRGFSRACNQGLDLVADHDAVLFLNNDVIRLRDRPFDHLRDELARGVLVGAELKSPPHTAVDGRVIPYLDGWCLAGMVGDLIAIGGWDETFEEPSYFGDNDLCLRARQAGMRLVAADVGLRHISNVSSRLMDVSGVSARNYQRYAARVREHLAVA